MATNYILSENLTGTIPEEIVAEVIKDAVQTSTVMNLAKVVPMKTPTKKFPVLLQGAGAYWVGEGQRIQTSGTQWATVELIAKKLATIIPVSKEALNDSVVDVMSELKGEIAKAFAKTFDKAALFGIDSPFATNIYTSAKTIAGNAFVKGSVAEQDLASDISDVMALVEEDGYNPNGFIARIGIKNQLRKLRDNNGSPLYVPSIKDGTVDELYNLPIQFAQNDAWDATKAELIAGNFDYAYYGILNDIAYEVLKEATLNTVTMADGKPMSLAEQDMVALKATMRIAFLVIKDKAFAVLEPEVQN